MTRLVVSEEHHGPLDEVREALNDIGVRLASLRGSGAGSLEILSLLDRAAAQLDKLEADGADVRAERASLDSAWQGLQRRTRMFLHEVGPTLKASREKRGAETLQPWWYLDQAYAQANRQAWKKRLLYALAAVLVLTAAALIYNRFFAPSPALTEALDRAAQGEMLLASGDGAGALAEFEAAAALTPQDPQRWLQVGIAQHKLGNELAASDAYKKARSLGLGARDFLFRRGMMLCQIGDLKEARVDAATLIAMEPSWGYGFYLQASAKAVGGDTSGAVADFETASGLANAAGDSQLEAMSRMQMAFLLQSPPLGEETP